jgi:hypothetical protein
MDAEGFAEELRLLALEDFGLDECGYYTPL